VTITIHNTDKMVELQADPDGRVVVGARLWEGHTESGIAVHVLVVRLLVDEKDRQEEFERELQETRPCTPAGSSIPMRLIL